MSYPTRLLMRGFVTHDTDRYIVERPAGFTFEPGQGCELTIERPPWQGQGRPFTPTCRVDDLVLEFTIKRYAGSDSFTMALHDLEPGAPLTLSDAFGSITYQGPGVFIAAGAGVTPFLAILRQLAVDGALEGHRLLVSNKGPADLICGDELRHYLGERAVFSYTRAPGPDGRTQRIDADFLKGRIERLDQHFYICGPDAFVSAVNEALVGLGVARERLVYER